MAGKKKYYWDSCIFIAWIKSEKLSPGEEKNVREMLDNIMSNHARIGTILEERTKINKAAIPELFREAQTKDATFALGAGIVHEIRDINIPEGSSVISLVFQR